MIIRYKRGAAEPEGLPNAFEAFDDVENLLGEASVETTWCPLVWEERPLVLTIRQEGDPLAADALLGAATAQALFRAREGTPACIRVERAPGEQQGLQTLRVLGFGEDTRLVRMRQRVAPGPVVSPIPEGLTVVKDYLNDEGERRFYLERVTALFGEPRSMAWLEGLRAMPRFARMLLIDKDGAAGELVTWEEDGEAVADRIWVHPDWRRRGAGKFLLDFARIYWLECGLRTARMDVWSSIEPAVRLASSAGFRPAETVRDYPCLFVR